MSEKGQDSGEVDGIREELKVLNDACIELITWIDSHGGSLSPAEIPSQIEHRIREATWIAAK